MLSGKSLRHGFCQNEFASGMQIVHPKYREAVAIASAALQNQAAAMSRRASSIGPLPHIFGSPEYLQVVPKLTPLSSFQTAMRLAHRSSYAVLLQQVFCMKQAPYFFLASFKYAELPPLLCSKLQDATFGIGDMTVAEEAAAPSATATEQEVSELGFSAEAESEERPQHAAVPDFRYLQCSALLQMSLLVRGSQLSALILRVKLWHRQQICL